MKPKKEIETEVTDGTANLGIRRSCMNCKGFTSFRDDYCDDMAPADVGFCHNGNSPRFGNEGAGCEYVCDWHNYV